MVEATGYPEHQFAWNGEPQTELKLVKGVSVNLKFNLGEEAENDLAVLLIASDGRIVLRRKGISPLDAQWSIPSLLPDKYVLDVYSPEIGGPKYRFKDNPASEFGKVLDLSDEAGNTKEFSFNLVPNAPNDPQK